MRQTVLLGILFLLLILFSIFYIYHHQLQTSSILSPSSQVSPTLSTTQPSLSPSVISSITPSSSELNYCSPQSLKTSLTLSPAAGNIYGTFTIKNISTTSCKILGNSQIQPTFTAGNVTIASLGTPNATSFNLDPNQTIYAQVHYPNGPQCNGPTSSTTISFRYQISPNHTILFMNQNGTSSNIIQTCAAASQKTIVQLWYFSSKSIVQ